MVLLFCFWGVEQSPLRGLLNTRSRTSALAIFIEKGGIPMDTIPNLPQEQWRPIQGYKGKYLVSNLGRIKSLKHLKARILHTFINNKGYERVCLSKDGEAHHFLVSRLVAEAFCPNPDPDNATTVDHIDHDTRNNRADNLRWLSLHDNTTDNKKRRIKDNDKSNCI